MNWALIRDFVPRRTDVQCRERYMNVLHPSLTHEIFSPEEDEILRLAVEQYGKGKWSLVAAKLPTRTDNQCRRRWMSMQTGKPDTMRKRPGRPKVPRMPRGRPRNMKIGEFVGSSSDESEKSDGSDGNDGKDVGSGEGEGSGKIETGKFKLETGTGEFKHKTGTGESKSKQLKPSKKPKQPKSSKQSKKSTHFTRSKRSKKSNK
jgi:hypothetical protein